MLSEDCYSTVTQQNIFLDAFWSDQIHQIQSVIPVQRGGAHVRQVIYSMGIGNLGAGLVFVKSDYRPCSHLNSAEMNRARPFGSAEGVDPGGTATKVPPARRGVR